MSLPVVLRPEASRDAEEARDYLEAQQPGRGQAFLDRLNETLSGIGAMPEMYGVVWRNVRAARLRQFTYIVYYLPRPRRPGRSAGGDARQPGRLRLAGPRLKTNPNS